MDYSKKPDIDLISCSSGLGDSMLGPEELSAIGAYGCFDKKSSREIWSKMREMHHSELKNRKEIVFSKSSQRGHESVVDQNFFAYSMKDVPRLSTLFLCGPEYLSHEQQSLRRASPERGFYLPEDIENSSLLGKYFGIASKILNNSFKFYQNAVEAGVPKEDARNPLPLYTRTNIQTAGNARELMHIRKMAEQETVPSIVKYTVEEMLKSAEKYAGMLFKDSGYNYETLSWRPSSQLFAKENTTINNLIDNNGHPDNAVLLSYSGICMDEVQLRDAIENRNETELANMKHIHFDYLAPMSLSCFHQATRQRTWNQSVESIYDAAKRRKTVVPPTVKKCDVLDEYNEQNENMFDLYESLIGEGVPVQEAVGVLPHSMEVYDLIHIDGWNAVHSIGKRTCTEAQWEIRNIAKEMAKIIKKENPVLGKYAEPQCIVYGKCPESNPCGYFKSHKS